MTKTIISLSLWRRRTQTAIILEPKLEIPTTVMKYSQLRRGLSPEDAAAYVGSKELLRQFERAKWVKPFIRGNRLTRFDIRDLDACIDRLKAGEPLPNGAHAATTP